MAKLNPPDFLTDLLGLKKVENLTEKQKLGKKLMEIAKQHPTNDNCDNKI